MQRNNNTNLVVSFVAYSGINKFNLKRSLVCLIVLQKCTNINNESVLQKKHKFQCS